jgi:hypothetical protein
MVVQVAEAVRNGDRPRSLKGTREPYRSSATGAAISKRARSALQSSVVWRGVEPSGMPAKAAVTGRTKAGSASRRRAM